MKNPLPRQDGSEPISSGSRQRQTAGHCLRSARDTKPAAGTPPGGAAGTVWTAKAMHATFSQATFTCHQSVTFSRIFRRYAADVRGKELHHDRFGSRHSDLRHAGAWPDRRRGPRTRRSSATISPIPPSSWKPRSRARRGRSPNPPRRCGPMPTPPSGAPTSAPACRSSGRSPPPRPKTAPIGSGSPRPSSRSAPPVPANRPSCSSAPRPRPTSPISAPATRPRRPMRWPCSAGRCPSASCGVRRWMRCGCRSTCARSPRSAASMRRCATSTASGCWITPSIPTGPRRGPASSSPRTSPSGSISRRSWRWPAPTSRR